MACGWSMVGSEIICVVSGDSGGQRREILCILSNTKGNIYWYAAAQARVSGQ